MKKLIVIGLSLLLILTWQKSALADAEVQSGDKIQLDEKVKLIRSGKVIGALPKHAVVHFIRFDEGKRELK